ncbi:hypothetical protein [Psychrobacter sp. I-STPA6b]|nr:hypothetical protein [Psychrobacter sp. I-STPA6b]
MTDYLFNHHCYVRPFLAFNPIVHAKLRRGMFLLLQTGDMRQASIV